MDASKKHHRIAWFMKQLNNQQFKGVEFDALLNEARSNAFTLRPTRWVELTNAQGIITKNGSGEGTYAQ